MGKKAKKPVRRESAKSTAVTKLAAHVEREVQRRLGPKATFEQRNDMSAQVMQEVLFKRSDDDLRSMVAGDDEVVVEDDEDDARYRRLDQPSSATYFGRWGSHYIEESLYRKMGERNGPTIKPIELRAGIVEHMTPDCARIVGLLGAAESSRELERTLRNTGHVPPSRAFLEKRFGAMARNIEKNVESLEATAREMKLPAGVTSASCGLDRFAVRMNEELEGDAANESPRPHRSEPYERTPPPPMKAAWKMAYVGTASVYDKAGNELATWRHAMPADGDAAKLAERVSLDILRLVTANPHVIVHCVQDGAPELDALPRALARVLPANVKPREVTDFEHTVGYLEDVVDACEPAGDPHDWKGWYRSELLRDDAAIDRIWIKLRRLAKTLPHESTKERDAVAAALSYIRHRKTKMRYATHYARKLPIGSGATEGTCWQMQDRVKRPGQTWEEGLGGVLAVRAFVLSERWDAAWDAYAARHRHELRCAA